MSEDTQVKSPSSPAAHPTTSSTTSISAKPATFRRHPMATRRRRGSISSYGCRKPRSSASPPSADGQGAAGTNSPLPAICATPAASMQYSVNLKSPPASSPAAGQRTPTSTRRAGSGTQSHPEWRRLRRRSGRALRLGHTRDARRRTGQLRRRHGGTPRLSTRRHWQLPKPKSTGQHCRQTPTSKQPRRNTRNHSPGRNSRRACLHSGSSSPAMRGWRRLGGG